jgi:hypothetical protein
MGLIFEDDLHDSFGLIPAAGQVGDVPPLVIPTNGYDATIT